MSTWKTVDTRALDGFGHKDVFCDTASAWTRQRKCIGGKWVLRNVCVYVFAWNGVSAIDVNFRGIKKAVSKIEENNNPNTYHNLVARIISSIRNGVSTLFIRGNLWARVHVIDISEMCNTLRVI